MAAVKNIAKALEPYTSCDLADALTKLKIPHGGFLPNLHLYSPNFQSGPTKIIGPAYTVQYRPHNYPISPNKPSGHYIDSVPAGSVLFISAPPKMINACYGGLMSMRAKYLQAQGTIIDGRLRDLQEHRNLEFPVFARGVGTTAPAEEAKVTAINEPVRFNSEEQDSWIYPGDIIVADLNGVVVLPQGLTEQAVELIASQVEADENVARDIREGKTVGESMKKHRANVKQPKI